MIKKLFGGNRGKVSARQLNLQDLGLAQVGVHLYMGKSFCLVELDLYYVGFQLGYNYKETE